MDGLDGSTLSLLADRGAVAVLFAAAIVVAGQLLRRWLDHSAAAQLQRIAAEREAELARIGIQQRMADAIHAQAAAAGETARMLEDLRRESAETGITLRVMAQRSGWLRLDDTAT